MLPPRDFGIPRGARVVLTVERQTGVPGVTSLIIAREIPRAATTLGYRTRWEQQMTTASRAAEVDIVVPRRSARPSGHIRVGSDRGGG